MHRLSARKQLRTFAADFCPHDRIPASEARRIASNRRVSSLAARNLGQDNLALYC
jgi:hypothetical protein